MDVAELLVPPAPWTADALCAQTGPDLFFPEDYRETDKVSDAQAVCARCPVRRQCLNVALERGEEYGIWGGLTPRDRRRLVEARRRAVA